MNLLKRFESNVIEPELQEQSFLFWIHLENGFKHGIQTVMKQATDFLNNLTYVSKNQASHHCILYNKI